MILFKKIKKLKAKDLSNISILHVLGASMVKYKSVKYY